MMKTTIAATIVALGVATPANAHHYRQQYYPQYQYDRGPATARGIFGAVVGPTIPASVGGGHGVVSVGAPPKWQPPLRGSHSPDEQDQKRAIDFGVQSDVSDGFARSLRRSRCRPSNASK
jgi:Mn2+/Fe2+ NRAMP family transporter